MANESKEGIRVEGVTTLQGRYQNKDDVNLDGIKGLNDYNFEVISRDPVCNDPTRIEHWSDKASPYYKIVETFSFDASGLLTNYAISVENR